MNSFFGLQRTKLHNHFSPPPQLLRTQCPSVCGSGRRTGNKIVPSAGMRLFDLHGPLLAISNIYVRSRTHRGGAPLRRLAAPPRPTGEVRAPASLENRGRRFLASAAATPSPIDVAVETDGRSLISCQCQLLCCVGVSSCPNHRRYREPLPSKSGEQGFPAGNNCSPEISSFARARFGRARRRFILQPARAAVFVPQNFISLVIANGRPRQCAPSSTRRLNDSVSEIERSRRVA